MEIYPKDALISAFDAATKPVAFLVGSPFSTDQSGKGVPGVTDIIDIIREVVVEKKPSEIGRFENTIAGKVGASAYQAAISWLHAYVHQDAVNTVVRRAVLKSCLEMSTIGDSKNPISDGDPSHWYIPAGTRSLAALVCRSDIQYHGPILTTNFDPLLSLAIKDAGKRPCRRVLDSDGALQRDVDENNDDRSVVHLHGYWRGSDTLHTPTQLSSPRPKLKAALQRLLRRHLLVVVAYGGWDDVFTNALADLLNDDLAELEVLWCFRETDSALIQGQNKRLFDNMAPAITRGRFRCYGGIDCHSVFSELGLALAASPVSTDRITAFLSTDKNIDQALINTTHKDQKRENDFIDRYYSQQLEEALETFSSQPKFWVEPIIADRAEVESNADSAHKVKLTEIITDTRSMIIKAPPQFGLTCLAHHLIREAWRSNDKALWLYLDLQNLNPNEKSIDKTVKSELKLLGANIGDIKCVVIDSWADQDKVQHNIVQDVCKYFKDIRIIAMRSAYNKLLFDQSESMPINRQFESFYLWTLPRENVRKVVSSYNKAKHIGEEDSVLSKVITDLDALNIHRTPLNCLLLLKASEVYFDESPVNRTEMINRVLFLLFNVDDIPTYKTKPDLKDCEFVLGYFCERMIRDDKYYFTRDFFLEELKQCCKNRLIELEVNIVFDVLTVNHILIKRGDLFCFRFAYWIYYFAAQRMHHDQEFAKYIFADKRYAKFPEIIEFYTGIDRRREDALQVLIDDVRTTCDRVQEKCGIQGSLNPFKYARWEPSAATLENMTNEITDGVMKSNLPDSIKDRYADSMYDKKRAYDQEIRDILTEYSYEYMKQTMKAGARALRNSDYVNPEIKRQLLTEIMRCWGQVSNVLLILTPLLIKKGRASFDGTGFSLVGDFGNTEEERLQNILNSLPINVVNWYKEDIFSQKMGLLLIDQIKCESNELIKHMLILLMILQRPHGWKETVHQYIVSINKNSFYLYDVFGSLVTQYRYSYASNHALSEIKHLLQMSIAKHQTGSKMPGLSIIKKFKNAIPKREVKSLDEP
jgi:SIR2-like domain